MNSPTLMLQEKMLVIDQIPLFSSLSLKDKKLIAHASTLVEYKKDEVVYEEGSQPSGLYCVITGRLKACIKRPPGRIEDLEYIKRGRYFGVISLLTGEPHSVTVQAINDSIILKIPKGDFDKALRRIPQLAIDMGQALSRRLKRKDLHEKRVFESTIISIFGTSDKIGTTNYALNFAIGLRLQTNKKVILLDISKSGEDISSLLKIKVSARPIILSSPYFDEETVRRSIFKSDLGIDIVNIPHRPDDKKVISNIIPLLGYLTNDYHYILVDLPSYMDKTSFESMRQADMVHIITRANEPSLRSAAELIKELEKASSDMARKTKVITSEYGLLKVVDFANRKAILNHEVFATLPDMAKSAYKIDMSKIPILTSYPDCEYSKAIRRISREVGDCLVGLALGSGAALGLAHIGILKVIEKEKIPIDIIVGTSIGAMIGALWASGKDSGELEEIALRFKSKLKTFGMFDLTLPRKGLIKGRQVRRFLRSQLGDKTFYDLRLPFKIVACDIEKREEVVLDSGSLVDAVMASIATPGIFEPVRFGGRTLVDGGIINPVPTNVLTRMGVAKIIAVNALPAPEDVQRFKKKAANIFDIIVKSVQASEYLLAEMSCQHADVAIRPIFPGVEWYEFYESSNLIRRGEEEASKYIAQMKELALVS